MKKSKFSTILLALALLFCATQLTSCKSKDDFVSLTNTADTIATTDDNISMNYLFTAISTSGTHTMALKSDSTLWTWGDKSYGQLGDGTNTDRNTPVRVGIDSDWAMVSAGDSYTIALKTNGSLWAWGNNSYGQLGNDTKTNSNTPVQIGTETDWVKISAGGNHTIALKMDGSIWAWGHNWAGQLGLGSNDEHFPTPLRVGIDTDWTAISAGYKHTLALKTDGSLWAWGNNDLGLLGVGMNTSSSDIPIRVGTDTDWATISAGINHTAALKTDGSIWTWGYNDSGELGDGTYTLREIPSRVGKDTNWAMVSAGDSYTIALKTNGSLWAWGGNDNGQLGYGTNTGCNTPTIVGTDMDWSAISVGGSNIINGYTIALKIDGSLWAWGSNRNGKLGGGTKINHYTPTRVFAIGATQVASDTPEGSFVQTINHTNATTATDNAATVEPKDGSISPHDSFRAVSAGLSHTLALKADGSLYARGRNEEHQLGLGSNSGMYRRLNTFVRMGTDADWAAVSAGGSYTIALKTDGSLWAWGSNVFGQLGINSDDEYRTTPVRVGTDTDWAAISAGHGEHALALKADGSFWAWGGNSAALCLGTDVSDKYRNTPIRVGIDTDWTAISAGGSYTMALKKDGSLWTCGADYYGQLGRGTRKSSRVPVRVGIDTNWVAVSAGHSQTIALKTDGSLWTWGDNNSGRVERHSPARVGTDTNWTAISAGDHFTVALKADGSLWFLSANSNTPIRVGTDTDWSAISASWAIKNDGSLWGLDTNRNIAVRKK